MSDYRVSQLLNGTRGVKRRIETLTAATDTWTHEDTGTLFVLDRAAGIDVTLPAIGEDAHIGTYFEVLVKTAASGDTYTITALTGDLLSGRVRLWDTDTANTVATHAPDGSDDLIITLSDTADLPGTRLLIEAVSLTSWAVTGDIYHTGNSATPFS